MRSNILLPLVAFLVIGFAACKKAGAPGVKQDDNAAKVYAYILDLGFPANQVVDKPDEFIVEGDMAFTKNMIVPTEKVRTEQAYTGSKVSPTNVTNIRLKIDASVTSMTIEIITAIDQWNNIPGCRIHWSIVTGSSFDVLIKDEDLGDGVCGRAAWPSGGNAGNLIRINKSFIAGMDFFQRTSVVCHEMGHIVSFRHTNWEELNESGVIPVPGVILPDAASLMNGFQCGSAPWVLSTFDKLAAVVLYPL